MKKNNTEEKKGSIQGDARYRTSAAGRSRDKISILFSKRNSEFLKLWKITGHWWEPESIDEKLRFIEGEL
ncbi:MAG: hypothetical protein J7L63_05050 [Thermoplasmata archaeon]|nr:hypothetical protein [Thermoplasmata archaeon]